MRGGSRIPFCVQRGETTHAVFVTFPQPGQRNATERLAGGEKFVFLNLEVAVQVRKPQGGNKKLEYSAKLDSSSLFWASWENSQPTSSIL